jgi:hypothetical protein
VQLTATGTIYHGSHPSSTQDVTGQAAWASSTPTVATVNSSGLATAVGAGTTTISATVAGTSGATATLTVTAASGGNVGGALVLLTIIPSSQSVASPGQTAQFLAIGTTTSGATENITSQVAWSSSSAQVATIAAGGLATAVGQGSTTITAIATNSNNTVVTGTATFTVSGGTSEQITAITIIPNAESLSDSGQTAQFIALGTSGTSGLQLDVTQSAQLVWSSSIPSVATVGATGLATGKSLGASTITAEYLNPDHTVVSATATVTTNSTPAPEPLLSLTIIPGSITTGNLQGTGNFMAIGTFSTPPYIQDLTNSVTWVSSAPNIFPVSSDNTTANPGAPGGIVTAYGNGNATIIAEASSGGSIQTATAQFACPLILPCPIPACAPPVPGSCFPGSEASSLLSTVTVYNEGLNTSTWLVTAPSATGTPNVIHCGPGSNAAGFGGSVCVATYPIGTPIILTAPAGVGNFGGWSSNCTPNPNPPVANGQNQCTLVPTTYNETVGAIFN